MSDIPRRNDIHRCTPAELVILTAMRAVESLPPHPMLTAAISLLEQARGKVADFVDQGGEFPTGDTA